MAPLYYRGALAAILVYDVTDESSFDDIKIWLEGESRSLCVRRM
jgi:GTPase SAR1 family protein